MKIIKAEGKILDAAYDMRFLLNRGYSRKNSLSLVANRYGLSKKEQRILYRGVYNDKTIKSRMKKMVSSEFLKNKSLALDWYNVYITVEGGFIGEILIMCDDGFLRDIRGIYGKKIRITRYSEPLHEIFSKLSELKLGDVYIYLDAMISKSGELRALLEEVIRDYPLNSKITTAKSPDMELIKHDIVATSDGVVIDKAKMVFDLALFVLADKDIKVISLK